MPGAYIQNKSKLIKTIFFSYLCLDETEERKDGEGLSFGIQMDKKIKGVHLFCSVTLVWCVMQSASH